jgi:hypothetical protein
MSGIQQAKANSVLDSLLTGTMVVRLYTAAPTATTNGTETSGSGYVAQTITFNAAAGGSKAQSADVNFPAATSNYAAPIVGWAVTDGSGNILIFLAVSSFSVLSGDQVKFLVASNPITATLS